MKSYLLLTVIAVCSMLSGFGQRQFYGRPIRLGFKVDPVFYNAIRPQENGIEKSAAGFGINYGLMADVMFRDGRGAFATGLEIAHASAELAYKGNAMGLNHGDAQGDQQYKIKLQYLQIPLSVKLKTNENYSGLRWWGQFGTYMGALLRSRTDYSYTKTGGGNVSETNRNIINETNKVNMGLLVGAGGEYRIADRTDLFFGLGFENGFTDITTNKNWNDGKVSLNRWAVRLGLFF